MNSENMTMVPGANTKKEVLVKLLCVEVFIAENGFPFGMAVAGSRIQVQNMETKKREWLRFARQMEYWLAFKAITNLEKGVYKLTLASPEQWLHSPYQATSEWEVVDLRPEKIESGTKVKTKVATFCGADMVFFVSATQHDSR